MNIRGRLYKPVLIVMAALMFFCASRMQGTLNVEREKDGFVRLAVLSNAPPLLAFTTVALGGFRGLIANALWMRATELQEQERYFEMVQLSDWITDLEPHFTEVWTMQAWNMAYNISVKCKDFEERWRWVQRGLNLLHKGLAENPGEINIYRQLSWFFRHKIGQNLDDAHSLYKLRWAQQMQPIFGGRKDFDTLINPQTPEDRARAAKLRDVYHMDPAYVKKIDDEFGPLDWRLPEAHGIYWTELGWQTATEGDKELAQRNAYSLMQQACKQGGMLPPWVTNITRETFILWPNLALVKKSNEAFERVAQELPEDKRYIVRNAQKNFLKDAVVLLYEYNHTQEANQWFTWLRNNITNSIPDKSLTMEDFAFNTIQAEIMEQDPVKATYFLLGVINQEYVCLIGDDDDRAARFRQTSTRLWQSYQSRLPEKENGDRIRLDPLDKLREYELGLMEMNLSPVADLILRSKLGLPPKPAPATRATTPPTSNGT